jgi:hypothetical protein
MYKRMMQKCILENKLGNNIKKLLLCNFTLYHFCVYSQGRKKLGKEKKICGNLVAFDFNSSLKNSIQKHYFAAVIFLIFDFPLLVAFCVPLSVPKSSFFLSLTIIAK